jgi:hypothetical protein
LPLSIFSASFEFSSRIFGQLATVTYLEDDGLCLVLHFDGQVEATLVKVVHLVILKTATSNGSSGTKENRT